MADHVLLALLVLALAGFALWAMGGADRPLRRSPMGFDGLVEWLRADGAKARSFGGGTLLERADVGLRVLPLYDGNLDHWRDEPASSEELLHEADQVDIMRSVVLAKIRLLPTLVVLPKWRTGLGLTGLAHPELLRAAGDDPISRGQLSGTGGRVDRPAGTFGDFAATGTGLRARLYLPQLLRDADCVPLIGDRRAMLLGRCGGDAGFWLLADPDLLNNHGLRLGDNAAIARLLLRQLAGGGPVVVDYSTHVWTAEERRADAAARSWSDLARFFVPPFAWLWAGAGLLTALLLWRASVRYGPPLRPYADGPGAARAVGIAAKGRLLRLSGHDGALLRAHVAVRLQALAAELLGPYRPAGPPLEPLQALIARRDAALAGELAEAVAQATALPARAPAAETVRRLDRFEIAMRKVSDGLGRPAHSR